jgi:hypothetical protein
VSEPIAEIAVSEVPAEVVTPEAVLETEAVVEAAVPVVSEPVADIAVSEVPAEVATTEEVVATEDKPAE